MHYYLEQPNQNLQQRELESIKNQSNDANNSNVNDAQHKNCNQFEGGQPFNKDNDRKSANLDQNSFYNHAINRFMFKTFQFFAGIFQRMANIIVKAVREPDPKSKYTTLFIIGTILVITLWIIIQIVTFFGSFLTVLASFFSIYALVIIIAMIFCAYLFRSMLNQSNKKFQNINLKPTQSNGPIADTIANIIGQGLIKPILIAIIPVMIVCAIMGVILSPLILLYKFFVKLRTAYSDDQRAKMKQQSCDNPKNN